MKSIKKNYRISLWMALLVLSLIPFAFFCTQAKATNDAPALQPLAMVLSTEGEFSEIQPEAALFANRTHKFAESVPDYLRGKSFLFQDLSGVSVTAKTSGWIYVLTEKEGTSSQAEALTAQGYERISEIEKGILSTTLKSSVVLFGKMVEAGEAIQYHSWGLLIADFISSEDQMYEKQIAHIESADGVLRPLKCGEAIFANRTHVFGENIPSWLEGKYYLQKHDINSATTFTAKSAGWVYILVESTNTKGVNETLADTYHFDKIGTIGSKGISQTLTKSIFIYAKCIEKGETVSFPSWGLVIGASYATLRADSYEMGASVIGGGQIFTDRPESHLFVSNPSKELSGMPLIQGSLGTGSVFHAVSDGYVYIATPSPAEGSKSQYEKLRSLGFCAQYEIAPRQLSSSIKENLTVMARYVKAGDVIEYTSWAITFALLEKTENHIPLAKTAPTVIYNPTESKYQDANRNWQGIPAIAKDERSGRLFASWYSGGDGEGSENFALLYTSEDDGKTWNGPIAVIDHEYPVRIFDPNLWVDPDGRLWWIWSQSFTRQDGVFGTWMMYTDNPESECPIWSEPIRVANGVAMNDPVVLQSGEWILPTAIWEGSPYVEAVSAERYANAYLSTDKGASFTYLGSVPSYESERSFDENMIVEMPDGTLRMLIRTQGGIEESFSYDKGRTWTAAKNTNLTDVSSRFYIRTLASGNQILIYNNPRQGSTDRSHLSVALSVDGGKSWQYRLVIDERAATSYPDAIEDEDGNLYIIYDHTRSRHGEILMAKIRESDIIAGKIVEDTSYLARLVNNNISKEQAHISASSLCLGGDLSMKYSLRIEDEALLRLGDITMHFTMNNTTIVCSSFEMINHEYVFRFSGIGPQQMTDGIHAVAYAGKTPIAAVYDHSVRDYCQAVLLSDAETLDLSLDAYEAMKMLITDLLHYGVAAQIYQSYRVDRLATDGVVGLGNSITTPVQGTDYVQGERISDSAYFTSVGLWFDCTNRIYVKFIAQGNARVLVRAKGEIVREYDFRGDGIAYSPEIFATDFNLVYTFELYEDDTLVQSVDFSVKSYVYAMASSENAAMRELALRLYSYGSSAQRYQRSIRDE